MSLIPPFLSEVNPFQRPGSWALHRQFWSAVLCSRFKTQLFRKAPCPSFVVPLIPQDQLGAFHTFEAYPVGLYFLVWMSSIFGGNPAAFANEQISRGAAFLLPEMCWGGPLRYDGTRASP